MDLHVFEGAVDSRGARLPSCMNRLCKPEGEKVKSLFPALLQICMPIINSTAAKFELKVIFKADDFFVF